MKKTDNLYTAILHRRTQKGDFAPCFEPVGPPFALAIWAPNREEAQRETSLWSRDLPNSLTYRLKDYPDN